VYIEGKPGSKQYPPPTKLVPIYKIDLNQKTPRDDVQTGDDPLVKKPDPTSTVPQTVWSHAISDQVRLTIESNVSRYEVNGMLIMYLAGLALLFAIYHFLKRGTNVWSNGKPRPGARGLESVSIDSGALKLH